MVESGGLTGGVTAWHLGVLCDNPWNGGGGYDPNQIAMWSLDQIWFRLCGLDILKMDGRTEKVKPGEVGFEPDEDGRIMGRAEDGTPIRGIIRGKSLARELMERQQAKADKARMKRIRKRHRKRKG